MSNCPLCSNKKRSIINFFFLNFHQNLATKSSHQFINTVESTMEVKVRLDNTNQPEFKNLMSLASSGEQPLAVDTEEVDRINNGNLDELTNNSNKPQSRDRNDTTNKTNGISKQKLSSRSNSRQTDSRKC